MFAPLVPVERVWVEDYGLAGLQTSPRDVTERLVSLDEPPRRSPIMVRDADSVTGRRVVQISAEGGERRDLRAVTELHTGDEGDICVRVAAELDWYRWAWSGRPPKTLAVPVYLLWIE